MINGKLGKRLRLAVIPLLLLTTMVMSVGTALADSFTISQTGLDVAGWAVGPDPDNELAPAAVFETGPGTPPAGTGSLQVAISGVPGDYSKFLLTRDDYAGTALADFTELSYATYYDSVSTGTRATWYLNLYISTDADANSEYRLDFAPRGFANDTWTSWDLMTDAYWRIVTLSPISATPSNLTWAQILAAHPTAVLADEPLNNAAYPSMVFNMGDSQGNYRNITTNIDNIRIGVSGASDDWDLEVPVYNLTATKTNNVSGATEFPAGWDWEITVSSDGNTDVTFADGDIVLQDDLPTGVTATVDSTDFTALLGTGTLDCLVSGGTLTCTAASGTVIIPRDTSFTVTLEVTPSAPGEYANPDSAGVCRADPDGLVTESSEADNDCADTVTVSPTPVCLLANCSFEDPTGADQYPTSWKRAAVKIPTDGTDIDFMVDGAQSFRFDNVKAKGKKLWQDLAITGPLGDQFSLDFSWRGEDVAGNKGLFRVMVVLYYQGGGTSKYYANMPIGTFDWTEYNITFNANKAYKKLRVQIDFGKQGTAWFDNFELAIN